MIFSDVMLTGNSHQPIQSKSGPIARCWQSEGRGSRTQQDRWDPLAEVFSLRSSSMRLKRMCVSGVEVGTPTHFTIYTKGAGKAKPEVHFAASRPGEAVRDFEIIDNHDYSYTVKYTALQQVEQFY